jgi:Tol biopolymer transport system component
MPTADRVETTAGMVMGTVSYMSPEQASGRKVDYRSDQFSFGSILYEMLTGHLAFRKQTNGETLAAILRDDPLPVTESNAEISAPVGWIVERCLAKDPQDRYASTRDLARDLALAREHVSHPTSSAQRIAKPARAKLVRERLGWAAGGFLLAAAIAALAVALARPRTSRPQVFQLPVALPTSDYIADDSNLALSPDARILIVPGGPAFGNLALIAWDLSGNTSRPLTGTEGATYPFWAPDGRSLGFFQDGKLKTIELSAGTIRTLCDAPGGRGGSWGRKGRIVFAPGYQGGLESVAVSGGEPKPVTVLDAAANEFSHRFPWFLPDGETFVYLASTKSASDPDDKGIGLFAGSIARNLRKRIVRTRSSAAYVSSGYLVFADANRALVAQRFDPRRLELAGSPSVISSHVSVLAQRWNAEFSVSETGAIAFFPENAGSRLRLALMDRSGKEIRTVGPPGAFSSPAFSPSGDRLAVEVTDPKIGTDDIWIYDLQRGSGTRFTSNPGDDQYPVWSPDGSRVAFSSYRNSLSEIFLKDVNGSAPERRLEIGTLPAEKSVQDWSPDGRTLVLTVRDPKGDQGIWLCGADGSEPVPFLKTEHFEGMARFSPGGRFIAYVSDQSGKAEIYVRPAGGAGETVQVSNGGGYAPRWSRNGKELFFLDADFNLFAVSVTTEPAFRAGLPEKLFIAGDYDVAPDGKQFLVVRPSRERQSVTVTMILGWPALLER